MAFRFPRGVFGTLGGSFNVVRALVSALRLRSWMTLTKIKPPLTYRRTVNSSKYLTNLCIKYLEERPAYNEGWQAMVNNMISELKNGRYVSGSVEKYHQYEDGFHTVTYSVDINHNLEGATNYPDLMANYIQELQDIFRDYIQCYKDSESFFVRAETEWAIRRMALEKYMGDVEELMSEID